MKETIIKIIGIYIAITYMLSATGLLSIPSFYLSPWVEYNMLLGTTIIGVFAGVSLFNNNKYALALLAISIAIFAMQSNWFIAYREMFYYESPLSFIIFYLNNLSAVSFNYEIILPLFLFSSAVIQLTNQSSRRAKHICVS